jgi:hypothetical protein
MPLRGKPGQYRLRERAGQTYEFKALCITPNRPLTQAVLTRVQRGPQ